MTCTLKALYLDNIGDRDSLFHLAILMCMHVGHGHDKKN